MSARDFPHLDHRPWSAASLQVRNEPRVWAIPPQEHPELHKEGRRTSEQAAEDWVKERLVDCYNQ